MLSPVGTINGLVFYANVIQASKSIFFPHDNGSSFSSIFIAWLNLDLGIEACFYDGLDAYAKTWLQFAFPIYLAYICLHFTNHTVIKVMSLIKAYYTGVYWSRILSLSSIIYFCFYVLGSSLLSSVQVYSLPIQF